MQGCGIHLHGRSLREKKCFHQGGIIRKLRCDILLMSHQKNRVRSCHIDFRGAMILQRIELVIMPVTITNLHRHLAVCLFLHGFKHRLCLQDFCRRLIHNVRRQRRFFCQCPDQPGKINVFHYLPIFPECRICHFLDFHEFFLLISSVHTAAYRPDRSV